MSKRCEDASKNIDKISKEDSFYKSDESFIRGVLKSAKRVKAETGKRIIEGLWKEYGNKCLDLLCDFEIDFIFNTGDETKDKVEINKQHLQDVLGPLAEIEIVGVKVFKFLIEHFERIEKLKVEEYVTCHRADDHEISKNSDDKDSDDEMEEGEIDVDWESIYETAGSTISKLIQEGKYNSKEYEKEIKKRRDIPLDERMKIIRSKIESIKRIKVASDVEAVKKYINDKEEQNKCLKILKGVKEGIIKIRNIDEYSSKGFFGTVKVENGNGIFLKAAKQAIEANDLPSLIALSKGCFLPSTSIYSEDKKENCSLFEYACMVCADDCALYLLEEGGGVEQEFENGDRPLHQALREGSEEIGMFLIEKGADINAKHEYDITPLHSAAERNSVEIAKILIEKGADVKAKNKYGSTPLHYSAKNNSYEVAKLLIERGADINAKNMYDSTTLHSAAIRNSIEVSKLLIEGGADIDVKDKNGNTPLNLAAEKNNVEIVKLLIGRGTDVKTKNNSGNTPLHWATKNNSIELAKLLIEKGADIDVRDKFYGKTPLNYIAENNNVEVAKLLIKRGTNLDVKDIDGKTALHSAAENNCFEVAKLLIKKGAEIELKDKYGNTPLHSAAEKNSFEVAKLLIKSGANIEATNEYGITPYHWATKKNSFEVANLLKENGADIGKKRGYPRRQFRPFII